MCLQKEIRSSLVLSMLQQMLAEDKADMVREAVVKSLGIIMGYIDDPDKYSQVCATFEFKHNYVFFIRFDSNFTCIFLFMRALFCIFLCNRALSSCCCLWATRRRGWSVPPTKCSFLPSLPGAQNWATCSPSSSPLSSHALRSCSR